VQSYYKLNVPHQKSASTTPSTRHHFYLEFLHSENGSNNGRTRYNRCPSFSSIRLVDLPPGSPPQSCSGEAPPQICRLFPHRSNWSRTSGVRTPEQGIKDRRFPTWAIASRLNPPLDPAGIHHIALLPPHIQPDQLGHP